MEIFVLNKPMSMKRIHSVEHLPSEVYEQVTMRVDTNRSPVEIQTVLYRLVDWCLSMGVKKVKLNDMNSVSMARSISNDSLDIEYDAEQPVWDTENDINYII